MIKNQMNDLMPGMNTHDDLKEVWLMVEGLDYMDSAVDSMTDDQGSILLPSTVCDWCGDLSSSGYFVAIGNEKYGVCAICWGRSPSYVEFRREGLPHGDAYRRLTGESNPQTRDTSESA